MSPALEYQLRASNLILASLSMDERDELQMSVNDAEIQEQEEQYEIEELQDLAFYENYAD